APAWRPSRPGRVVSGGDSADRGVVLAARGGPADRCLWRARPHRHADHRVRGRHALAGAGVPHPHRDPLCHLRGLDPRRALPGDRGVPLRKDGWQTPDGPARRSRVRRAYQLWSVRRASAADADPGVVDRHALRLVHGQTSARFRDPFKDARGRRSGGTVMMKQMVIAPMLMGALLGQAPSPPPRAASMDDVVAEVRALRAEMKQSAEASLRAQLLVARLQVEEQRISGLARQLSETEQEIRALDGARNPWLEQMLKEFDKNP